MRVSPGLKMSPPVSSFPKSGIAVSDLFSALNTIDADISFAPGPLVAGAHPFRPSSHPSIEWIRMPAAAKDPSSFHGSDQGARLKRSLRRVARLLPCQSGGGEGDGGGGGGAGNGDGGGGEGEGEVEGEGEGEGEGGGWAGGGGTVDG